MTTFYGPGNLPDLPDINNLPTPFYLRGHAAKIKADLAKVARLYTGITVLIYNVDTTGSRCTDCTDSLTGEVLNSNCPTCAGTGYIPGYTYAGTYKVLAQLSPRSHQETEVGNTNTPVNQDVFTLIGEPLIRDRSILIIKETKKVYRVVDDDPQIVAMGGSVITQTVAASRITKPSPEYDLITW